MPVPPLDQTNVVPGTQPEAHATVNVVDFPWQIELSPVTVNCGNSMALIVCVKLFTQPP